MSSVKVPDNYVCTFYRYGHLSLGIGLTFLFSNIDCESQGDESFWTVVYGNLPAAWHVSFNDAAVAFDCLPVSWK
jgi:hypothetical protein